MSALVAFVQSLAVRPGSVQRAAVELAAARQSSARLVTVQLAAAALLALLSIVSAPQQLRAETADYTVTFESTWSVETHPSEFPEFPHFSGLIGGTHDDAVLFWEPGSLASPGIKSMAETGSKSPLDDEIDAAILDGTAGSIISGGGIGTSPGSVSKSFTIDDSFPLVTLVSMLAPSPDWFVGVSGLSLREDGEWLDFVTVDLRVFDAGTDSGPSYGSQNDPTVPPIPIYETTDGPFSDDNIVGTFTFRRETTGVDEIGSRPRIELVLRSPNPTASSSRFEMRVPDSEIGSTVQLDVLDIQGRLVRRLFHGAVAQGMTAEWDGADRSGSRVPNGMYFVRFSAGGSALSERVVVLR